MAYQLGVWRQGEGHGRRQQWLNRLGQPTSLSYTCPDCFVYMHVCVVCDMMQQSKAAHLALAAQLVVTAAPALPTRFSPAAASHAVPALPPVLPPSDQLPALTPVSASEQLLVGVGEEYTLPLLLLCGINCIWAVPPCPTLHCHRPCLKLPKPLVYCLCPVSRRCCCGW